MQVASGPAIADAKIVGSQIRGFFMMFGICSIDVPKPCDTSPPKRFSLNDITAKPTICAQHPTIAAPPARANPFSLEAAFNPVSESAAQIAAELIGKVSAMPTSTDTMSPITNGACSVLQPMNCAIQLTS